VPHGPTGLFNDKIPGFYRLGPLIKRSRLCRRCLIPFFLSISCAVQAGPQPGCPSVREIAPPPGPNTRCPIPSQGPLPPFSPALGGPWKPFRHSRGNVFAGTWPMLRRRPSTRSRQYFTVFLSRPTLLAADSLSQLSSLFASVFFSGKLLARLSLRSTALIATLYPRPFHFSLLEQIDVMTTLFFDEFWRWNRGGTGSPLIQLF